MRYWLLRRPPQHYTDINSAFINQTYEYDKVFVNPRLHEGDIVYLIAAYNELYGWGYVVKKESYRDNELNGRAYKLAITRPVLQQNLVPADEVKKCVELASAFLTEKNLVELDVIQTKVLNQLLSSKGVITPPEKKQDETPNFRVCEDFPKIEVPPRVEVWSRAAYAPVSSCKPVNPQEMLVQLWDQIPDFDYQSIDKRLIKFGVEPTLLGILQIDPTTNLCDQTDQVIRFVKRKIQTQPNAESVSAEEVSEELEIDECRVRLIFSFMHHLGKFWNGGSGDGNTPGYTTIRIDYEETKREYLKYGGLQPLLESLAQVEEEDKQSDAVDEPFIHSTLDWMFRERLENALSRINRLSSDEVIECDTERLAEIVSQFEIVLPVLSDQPLLDPVMPELEDMTFDLKTGATGHIVLVPIEGDGEWFQEINMQVVSSDDSPLAFLDKQRNWIFLKLTVSPDEPEGILKEKLDARLSLVRQYGDYVTQRSVSFNADLAKKMVQHLNKRKQGLERGRTEAEALRLKTTHNPRHAERAIQIEKLTETLNARFKPSASSSEVAENDMHEKDAGLSDLHDDALKIARYMYTHKFFGSRSTTREELRRASNLSKEDFDAADEYLLQAKICDGTMGEESGQRWLTSQGVSFVKTSSLTQAGRKRTERKDALIDIFVSHSSQDVKVAKAVVELLRVALNVPANRIRCTSVDGYRLPAGAVTNDQLRVELRESKSLIALITKASIESTYVLFELGARWGAELPLVPLLVTSTEKSLLGGPLGALNALACDSRSQIHQLIDDVATHIGVEPGKAASYQEHIDAVLTSATPEGPHKTEPAAVVQSSVDFERMSQHVLNYFTAKGFTKYVGFESLRKYVNDKYSDEMLFQMIDMFPNRFRRVTLRGGKSAVGLVRTQS